MSVIMLDDRTAHKYGFSPVLDDDEDEADFEEDDDEDDDEDDED
jgi:hypothetical protein